MYILLILKHLKYFNQETFILFKFPRFFIFRKNHKKERANQQNC